MSPSGSGRRIALKRASQLDLVSSSDTSDESAEMEAATPQADAADSTFSSMWRDPFDASKLPEQISLALFKRAPFLLGRDHARYPTEFFKYTGGLCARGYKFKQLANDDLFPLIDLIGTYPTTKKGNRHPLKLIADRQTARDALHMYQRVYGGTQPDNGEFGTSFIRGLALFFQKNKDVNWAERACELASGRMKSPGKNPMKLTPPCLREQIQAMIDLFAHYLVDAYKRIAAAASKPKAEGRQRLAIPLPPSLRSPTAVASAPGRKGVNSTSLGRGSTSTARMPEEERQARTPLAPKPSPTTALLAKQRDVEGRLNSLLKQREDLELESAMQEQLLSQYTAAEEECWDQHHELRQHAKAVVGNDAEKARLNDAVRAKGREVSAATGAVESTKLLLGKSKSDLYDTKVMVEKLKLEIERMKVDISVLLVENSKIQPQSYSSLLLAEATDMSNIKISDPCASCQKYFAHSALAPFNCGCLFHPHCMFKTALLENVVCPRCLQVPSRPWMVQWGFASNNETIAASIQATNARSCALGWEPGKGISDSWSKELEEVFHLFEEATAGRFHMAKRSAEDAVGAGNSASSDRGKRICGSSLPKMPETVQETVVSVERTIPEVSIDACNSVQPTVVDVTTVVEVMPDAYNSVESLVADVTTAVKEMPDACNVEEPAVVGASNM